MNTLKNKIVFITGASSGLGKSLAFEYAKSGANVILTARRTELVSSLAEELSLKYQKCIPITCDVTKETDLEEAIKKGVAIFGKIDIVIANAGFGIPGKLEKLGLEDYRKLFETNVFGVLKTIYASLEELKKTKGSICIIGSINGATSPFPETSAYAMSKFAVRGLVEPLSLELSEYDIALTHIMPGFMNTDFDKNYYEKNKNKYQWLKLNPEKASKIIIKSIHKKKNEVILTRHAKIVFVLKNYFPFLLKFIIKLIVK